MKRVLTAVILIPVVLLAVLRAPFILFAALVAIVALLTAREFLDLVRNYGVQPFRMPTYVGIVLLFIAAAATGTANPALSAESSILLIAFAAVVAPFAFLIVGMRRIELQTGYPGAAASVFAITYVALPCVLLAEIRARWAGAFFVLFLLLLVWIGDTAAYYVGRSLGRHKLSPRVSPGKSWEGAIASLIASVALGVFLFHDAQAISAALLRVGLIERVQGFFEPTPPLGQVIALSAAINIAAQFGDLVESLIKRGAGVKDSGSLLPGHGGMLDRIDALLFAVPVLWYYATLRALLLPTS